MQRVIIIGAGPAGLTAGYELLKKNKYDVTILEKTDRIGGISQTVRYKGNRMDIGGHRFFSKDERVNEWWANIMPTQGAPSYDDKILGREKPLAENGPDPEVEDNVMLVRNRLSRIYYSNTFFDYPVTLKWSTIKGMGFGTTLKAGFSYLKTVFKKLPEDNLENFYINRFGRVLYSMFFEGYTEKLWGRHPREISADWGAQRVKGLSIRAVIKDIFSKIFSKKNREVETSLIEEYIYPKFGPGQLWENVADEITKMGGKVIQNSEVEELKTSNKKITTVVAKENGVEKEYDADIVISSMPVNELVAGIKNDDIPELVKESAADLPFRDFVTVGLKLKKLKLENKTDIKTLGNIVPDCWIYVQDTGVKLGRIQVFNNWSPYMVEEPEKNVWIGLEYFCREGDDFWNMSDEDCIQLAINELVKMDVIDKEDVIDSHRERIQKAYPAYFDGYKNMDDIIEYLDTIDNLYCVGRNGQHRYNNMDHSMATSFEAVNNIENSITDKSNIWNVNTEQEYHEEKNEE
ncbi:MAG: NAD(P)/FAD-dependent oxidoreductase [Eubacterium sp.]|nr:NAD(P)/FAD-dependent oxidoreductase [Eubacterium sp.]